MILKSLNINNIVPHQLNKCINFKLKKTLKNIVHVEVKCVLLDSLIYLIMIQLNYKAGKRVLKK